MKRRTFLAAALTVVAAVSAPVLAAPKTPLAVTYYFLPG